MAAASLGLAGPVVGQEPAPDSAAADTLPPIPPVITVGDIVGLTTAGALFVTPGLTGWGPETSDCAPCLAADVPDFDRWAITRERSGWEVASTVATVLLGVAAELDLAHGPDAGRHMVALVQSGAWALALSEVLKAAVGRRRPVYYTVDATGEDVGPDDRRSFPSAHTAGAFAVATSWWLSRRAIQGERRVPAWVAGVVAGAVGVMRVTAGRHFPSDVAAGAALGVASALTVHVLVF